MTPVGTPKVTDASTSENLPTLVTITVSHYSEKARWALQRYGIPYKEEAHAPGFHSLALKTASVGTVPCLRLPPTPTTTTTPTTATTATTTSPHVSSSGQAQAPSSPSWVCESTPILRWVQQQASAQAAPVPLLFPPDKDADVTRLCQLFDSKLGPAVRSWAYSHKLLLPRTRVALVAPPVPAWQRAVLNFGGWYAVRSVMMKEMKITPENGAAAFEEVKEVFQEVAKILEDGRRYLTGDTFTAADLTFAALAAPAVGQPYATSAGGGTQTRRRK